VGFFGVAAIGDSEAPAAIRHCHLNLWTLGGLFGYRVCYLDVGLHLVAGAQPLQQFRLGLPVCTPEAPDQAIDSLKGRVENPTVASLIFARKDAVEGGSVLIGDERVELVDIDRTQCSLAATPRTKDFSLWTVGLVTPLQPNQSGYLRIRFHIQGSGRLWLWGRSLLARNRAIVDLRVSDEREARTVPDGSEFISKLLPLDELNAFVIAPAAFAPAVTTPEAEYVRALEGQIWEKYLGRRTDLRRDQKFLIHHWRVTSPTTADHPFRAFLLLERRRSLLPSWSDLMPVLLAFALALALLDVEFRRLDWVGSVLHFLTAGIHLPITAVAIVAFIGVMVKAWNKLRDLSARMRRTARRIDQSLYSMKIDSD
jgi:hypothetical protein